jgi:predicted nucleic acid-binding protein
VEGDPARLPALQPVFDASADLRINIVIPSIAVAEALVRPFELGLSELVEEFLSFIRWPLTHVFPLDTGLAVRAAEVRAATGLAMADSIVVATAVASGAAMIVTNDRGLAKRSLVPCAVVDDFL